MEMNVFMDKLTEALIARGVTETNAQKHAETLRRSFDEDDLREIEDMDSTDEIDAIADSVAAILNRKKTEKPGQTDMNPPKNAPVVPIESQVKPVRSASDTTEDEYFEFDQGDKVTTKGMAIFWCGLFVTLPVTLAILAVIYGLFAAAFAVIFGLIIGLIIAMIAIIAAGAVCSLIGIIYGITQLFSFVARPHAQVLSVAFVLA